MIRFIVVFVCFYAAGVLAQSPTKIVFGSCLHQDKPQPIWSAILQEKPDVFLLLGDNVYGDTNDMQELKAKYQKQAAQPGLVKLRDISSVWGTWDDHDFGQDDIGAEFPFKEQSKQLMLDFFQEPKNSSRRTQNGGVYTQYFIGETPNRIQIILLDTRWDRGPLDSVSRLKYVTSRLPYGEGPYKPKTGSDAVMLGKEQWLWLENALSHPADFRIIASSIQFLPEFSGWESWANLPDERQRLLNLLAKKDINNAIFISGDTHWGELSRMESQSGEPLWEMTSSGLTQTWHKITDNTHRVGGGYAETNFGVVDVKWQPVPQVTLSLKDEGGNIILQQQLRLKDRKIID